MAISATAPTTATAPPYLLDPKDAVANYASTGLINAGTPPPSTSGAPTAGGLLTATNLIPGTATNADSSTFGAIGATPQQAAYGYTPSARALDPAKETVAGQFTALTQSGSPLIEMARTGANQEMNRRGLMDSSLALSAADAAAYQAALPIANADAMAFQQASRDNQAYGNEANKFGASAQNEAAKNDLAVWTDMAKANLDSAMKTQLASIEADYKTTMQGSATAAEMYKQAMKNITDIAASTAMNADAKKTATENQFYILKNGMEIAGAMANLDLGNLLDFSGAPIPLANEPEAAPTGAEPVWNGRQWVMPEPVANPYDYGYG